MTEQRQYSLCIHNRVFCGCLKHNDPGNRAFQFGVQDEGYGWARRKYEDPELQDAYDQGRRYESTVEEK